MFKKTFTVNNLELAIVKPTQAQLTDAQMKYNLAFNDAIKTKAPLRDKIDDLLREQGLWGTDRQDRFESLQKKVLDAQLKIQRGGKVNELRPLALDVMKWRDELIDLTSVRNKLDSITVEGISENARLNYLFTICLVYNETGKPYFASYDDYLNSKDESIINESLKHFYAFIIGVDSNVEDTFEKKFLKRFKFMNDQGLLLNKDGKLVDLQGRTVNEFGQWVNDKNEIVDINNNPIDPITGEFKVECDGFYDDEGNRLDVEEKPQEKLEETKEITIGPPLA